MVDKTIEFSKDGEKFSNEYKRTYPVTSEESEQLRATTNKIINFRKVRNLLFNMALNKDKKFVSYSHMSVKCIDYVLDVEIPLSEYVSSIKITDNYETDMMSIVEVKFLIPHGLLLQILKLLSKDTVTLRFYIDPVNADRDDGGDPIPNKFNYASLESSNPHNGTPYIAVEYPTDELPNTSLDLDEEKKNTPFEFSLILLSEYGLRLKKSQFDYTGNLTKDNLNATYIPSIVDTHLEKVRELIPEINIYKKAIDNTNRFPNLSFVNKNIYEIISYLDTEYGTHLFGSNVYLEGNNLYIGDMQLQSFGKDLDLFIDVMGDTSAFDGGLFFERVREDLVEESKVINRDIDLDRYYVLTEESMAKPEFYKASGNELAGEHIVIRYNGKDRDLLLPRNLTSTNIGGDATMEPNNTEEAAPVKSFFAKLIAKLSPTERVVNTSSTSRYEKPQNAYFYESKMLSDYNDASGHLDVYLEGVNPDLFHHGKHIYVHFHNTNFGKIYNWEYKVVVKETLYPIGNKKNSLVATKIHLGLKKVIDELPYKYEELLTNAIYQDISIVRSATNIVADAVADVASVAVEALKKKKEEILNLFSKDKEADKTVYISKYITYDEMIKSETATKHGISNTPQKDHERNFRALCVEVIDPINEHFGGPKKVIHMSSSYRNPKVNALVGGSSTSQHPKGEAGDLPGTDFRIPGISVETIWKWIALNDDLPFDQLIYEFGRWVHVSHSVTGTNRKMIMIATGSPRHPVYTAYTVNDIETGNYSLT